jgi:hypothetical protein
VFTFLFGVCVSTDGTFVDCSVPTDIGVPGNLGPPVLQFAPIELPVTMLNPFGLAVDLSVNTNCGTQGGIGIISSCSASTDALDPQHTFLDAVGDFSLVSGSGHDYSSRIVGVPEPSPIALLAVSLALLMALAS